MNMYNPYIQQMAQPQDLGGLNPYFQNIAQQQAEMSAYNQRPAQNYYSAGMNPMDIPSDMDY